MNHSKTIVIKNDKKITEKSDINITTNSYHKNISTPEVIRLKNSNLTIPEIAKLLDIHEQTVKYHLKKGKEKLSKIKNFNDNKVNLYSYQQLEEYEIQELLRQDLLSIDEKTGKIKLLILSDEQKRRWYDTLNISSGTKSDKEHRERTTNIQVNIEYNGMIQASKDLDDKMQKLMDSIK